MTASQQILLDLESESEDEKKCIMLHLLGKKRRSKTNKYLQRTESHREFKLFSGIPDSVFKESFWLNRKQFSEVHELIKKDITTDE